MIHDNKVADSRTALKMLVDFIHLNAKDSEGNFEPVDIIVFKGFSGLLDILVHNLVMHVGVSPVFPGEDLIGRLSEVRETAWFLKHPKGPMMELDRVSGKSGMFLA